MNTLPKIGLWNIEREIQKVSEQVTKIGVDELDEAFFNKVEIIRDQLNQIIEMNPQRKLFMGTYAEKSKP